MTTDRVLSLSSLGFKASYIPLRPDLLLIACGECKQKIAKEYRVKKEKINKGRIFYKCLDREVGYYFSAFDSYG